MDASVRPADDLVILFTSGQPGRAEGRDPHPRRRARRDAVGPRRPRRSAPDDRLYIPMPFFWIGGLGTGLLSALVAGATLLTERQPEAAATLRLLERERVTLFRGWPDQAVAIAAHPDFATTDLSQPEAGQPARRAAARDARGDPAGGPNSSA